MRYYNFGDITPVQIQIFLAAAETENFSKTARILNITQPHVSNTVAALEYVLDFPLFTRVGRRVYLTRAGRILYESWKDIFALLTRSIDQAHQAYLLQNSSLTVADKDGLNKSVCLYPIIERFKEAFADCQISVEQLVFRQGLEAVADGEADVGLCLLSEIERSNRTGISWKVLASRPYLAFVPADSPLYARAVLSPEELAAVPIMLCNPSVDSRYNEDTLEIFRARGLTPTIHSYARDGISLSLHRSITGAVSIFSPFVGEAALKGLHAIPIVGTSAGLVLYWNNKSENAMIEKFVEAASECFPPE